MAYIERAIAPIIKKRVHDSKCALITGARQIGKSTLIKHEFPDFNRANFDDRLTRLQAKEEPKLFFLNNPCPLFIDEVQKENSISADSITFTKFLTAVAVRTGEQLNYANIAGEVGVSEPTI